MRRAVVCSYFVDNNAFDDDVHLYYVKRHMAGLIINSLTKYIGGKFGNAWGGAVTDTGLFDWTRALPNILRELQEPEARTPGVAADHHEGIARRRRRSSPRSLRTA